MPTKPKRRVSDKSKRKPAKTMSEKLGLGLALAFPKPKRRK